MLERLLLRRPLVLLVIGGDEDHLLAGVAGGRSSATIRRKIRSRRCRLLVQRTKTRAWFGWGRGRGGGVQTSG